MRWLRRLLGWRREIVGGDASLRRILRQLSGEDVVGIGQDEVGHPALQLSSGRSLVLRGVQKRCPRCRHVVEPAVVEVELLDAGGYVLGDSMSAERIAPAAWREAKDGDVGG